MKWLVCLAIGLCLVALASEGQAQTASFTKVADTDTPVPGSTGTIGRFGNPSISDGHVAVLGGRSGGSALGIYSYAGGSLNVVADESTPIPGGSGNFGGFNDPSIGDGNVAFRGSLASDGYMPGIYSQVGGVLNVVADTSTPIPGGSSNFGGFSGDPSISSGNVAFRGSLASDGDMPGIYSRVGGALNVVADTGTPIPGGSSNFGGFFGDPSISGANVAFGGAMGGDGYMPGIYTHVGGSLNFVADTSTSIPGGAGNFGAFQGGPAISGDHVAFRASMGDDGYMPGIYSSASGVLSVVADTSTMVPSGTETFGRFGDPAISGAGVAFVGGRSGGSNLGIFLASNGVLEMVIGLSDQLDGRTVADLFIGQESLDGNQLTFRASFTNGDQGIYVAIVPEPSAAMLIGCGLGFLAIRRRNGRIRGR
jgi:hypothetical protein